MEAIDKLRTMGSSELPSPPLPPSPTVSPIHLSDCMDELLRLTLSSSIDGTLEFDLPVSKDFCSHLLRLDPNPHLASLGVQDEFNGVPSYPLYKHLGRCLMNCINSGTLARCSATMSEVLENELLNRQDHVWKELIADIGLQLTNTFEEIGFELHVQEPFFSQLKAGLKSVEGRCAVGNYNRIVPGALLLFNKCLVLQVQKVKLYKSFLEMLESETLSAALPGVKTLQEGTQIYRNFYSEEKELSNGVLAISVSKPDTQPYNLMARLLSGLNYEGVARIIGLVQTVGTISGALPPPKSTLVMSFTSPHRPEVKGSLLTTGARALAKHANRGSDGWWGNFSGSDLEKNRLALQVLNSLMAAACWMNIHSQSHEEIFEIRAADGYGARWSKDGSKFIGFLEPYTVDGHSKGWKH